MGTRGEASRAWSPLPQGQGRSWTALGGDDASSDLQASMYHRERSRLQVSLSCSPDSFCELLRESGPARHEHEHDCCGNALTLDMGLVALCYQLHLCRRPFFPLNASCDATDLSV